MAPDSPNEKQPLALADLSPEEFGTEFRRALDALQDAKEYVTDAGFRGPRGDINEAREELRIALDAVKEFREERGRRFWKKRL